MILSCDLSHSILFRESELIPCGARQCGNMSYYHAFDAAVVSFSGGGSTI